MDAKLRQAYTYQALPCLIVIRIMTKNYKTSYERVDLRIIILCRVKTREKKIKTGVWKIEILTHVKRKTTQ